MTRSCPCDQQAPDTRIGGDEPRHRVRRSAGPSHHQIRNLTVTETNVLETDVLIVGAGPCGLATAIGLAMRGIDFMIVDALAEAQNTSRAAVIHAATLDALDGLQVADRLVSEGIRAERFMIRDRDEVLLHTDFSVLPGDRKFALMIPQDESERILIQRLADLGHQVRRPVRFSGCTRADAGVIASCTGPEARFSVKARLIVGADGEDSAVRSAAGIAFPGSTYGSFLLADVKMDWPIDADQVSLFFSGDGTLVVAPMSQQRYRVVAQYPDAPATPALQDVQHLLDTRGPRSGARVRDIMWGSRFRVHHKLADTFREGPVALVGDAAHVHSPAGGQGMNLGLRDACHLAEALARAVTHGDPAALDAYAAERRAAAHRMLRLTHRLTRVATLPDAGLRKVRNLAISWAGSLAPVRRRAAYLLAGYR